MCKKREAGINININAMQKVIM